MQLGDFEIFALAGGHFDIDGGAMFGVVPKVLWSKRCTPHDDNYLTLSANPILIKHQDNLIVLESGLGNKLTAKQQQIFRVSLQWQVPQSLRLLGYDQEDVTHVILSHYDFDHSGGVLMYHDTLCLTFPKALHILQKSEWEDVLSPNRRSAHTYWQINYELLKNSSRLELASGNCEVLQGLEVIHTGGHTRGHQIVRLHSQGLTAYYMGDLMPWIEHFNPLWITAYDNFPLTSIAVKEQIFNQALKEDAYFLFYHIPDTLACKLDAEGNVTERIKTNV